MTKKHVAVLMGGWSGEREVSLTSAKGVIAALRELGHQVTAIDVTRDIPKLISDLTPRPDIVMNILHGKYGEDGRIQSLLDILGIPYTFSNACASAIAMDKDKSKKLFHYAGITTPLWKKSSKEQAFSGQDTLPYPYVLKPFSEGSSLGVFMINNAQDLHNACQEWRYGDEVMLEEYIAGKELSVAIINGKAIGVIELRSHNEFYDYNAKYTDGITQHIMPAEIPADIMSLALAQAEASYEVIGCSGIARADFRYDATRAPGDQLHILEINTQPGMTPLSLIPDIANYCGINFNQLVQMMIEDVVCSEKCA